MSYDIGPYDPCPCGSGAKYKFCCAAKAKAVRHGKFPIGTVAFYGPDERTTTKIAAAVILRDGAEPILERWVGTTILGDPVIVGQIRAFFARHGVKNVVATNSNMGCPHEEGQDFPSGQDCPFCPFWAGKQGSAQRDDIDDLGEEPDYDDDDDDEDEDEEDDEALADEVEGDPFPDDDRDVDALFARVEAILGGRELKFDQAVDVLLGHLQANLTLPCEVTGIEDFQWEEPYVIGGWSPAEYKRLKKTQPSCDDRYQLFRVSRDEDSEWMMFGGQDIAAHVRRIADGKEFVLGLAELKAVDKASPNHQLLDDFAVWFVNNR